MFLWPHTESCFGEDQRLLSFRATGFTLHLYPTASLTSHGTPGFMLQCRLQFGRTRSNQLSCRGRANDSLSMMHLKATKIFSSSLRQQFLFFTAKHYNLDLKNQPVCTLKTTACQQILIKSRRSYKSRGIELENPQSTMSRLELLSRTRNMRLNC
jgi:hypothetical protein